MLVRYREEKKALRAVVLAFDQRLPKAVFHLQLLLLVASVQFLEVQQVGPHEHGQLLQHSRSHQCLRGIMNLLGLREDLTQELLCFLVLDFDWDWEAFFRLSLSFVLLVFDTFQSNQRL